MVFLILFSSDTQTILIFLIVNETDWNLNISI